MRRVAAVILLMLASIGLGALPALAHTGFESSDPADGARLDQPIKEIRLVFSGEAEPAGDGFVVRDAAGVIRSPDRVSSADNLTWVLLFDTPLGAGKTGVRWSVAAPDAHPIEGSFSFSITGSEPAAPEVPIAESGAEAAADDLDMFLETGSDKATLVGAFGLVARTLSILGAMLAIGGIAFAAIVLRGSDRDIRSVLFWVRRAAVILAFGTALELVQQLAVISGSWLTIWSPSTVAGLLWTPLALAITLRIIGAMLMLRAHLDVVPAAEVVDPVVAVQAVVGVGAGPRPASPGSIAGPLPPDAGKPFVHPADQAWRVDGELSLVGFGILAALASFVFDGHTVTEGMRLITAIVDMVHVAAGAVWAGGLVMLVHVVWLRHRRGSDVRALQLAIRFSVVAAAAVVVAGAAGGALALIILDSIAELWSTPWGRVLLAKVAIVVVAGAAGAYNHKVLIPHMLRRPPNDPRVNTEFRRAVSVEAVAMGLVILLTAVLVASAS